MKVKTITCPNCGHANNFLAEECLQCGINFSRYYDELEKAEALRQHIEEQEKAEALKREQEEKERREAEQRRIEEEKKAEALRLEKEEQERLEAQARRQAEEEKQRLEEEHRKKAQKRADILRRQKEELEKAEVLKRQQEEEEKAEALRRQQEEEEKAEALRRQQEEEAEIEVEELDDADLEEHAGAFDYIEYPPEDQAGANEPESSDSLPAQPNDYRPAASLEERLRMYEGRMVGITYGNPAEIQNVKLLAVSGDHFQVFYPISRNVVSFSYRAIVSITENTDGVSAVGPDISPVFPMVVELPRPFFNNT
ncbi:MAG: hypothetical protein JJV98_17265 [Desulfosarcina sp.]|nr:hypothetical protein [Desulfobacterales bacterium]